jgi:hypothetical protein
VNGSFLAARELWPDTARLNNTRSLGVVRLVEIVVTDFPEVVFLRIGGELAIFVFSTMLKPRLSSWNRRFFFVVDEKRIVSLSTRRRSVIASEFYFPYSYFLTRLRRPLVVTSPGSDASSLSELYRSHSDPHGGCNLKGKTHTGTAYEQGTR